MLLATSLLRIYPNYVPYGMYEIGDYLYVIDLALFYHSSYPSLYIFFMGKYRIQTYLSNVQCLCTSIVQHTSLTYTHEIMNIFFQEHYLSSDFFPQ